MNIKADIIEAHIYREYKGRIEFLLIKRSHTEIYPGLWQMVSGSVDEGEKAHQTAKREILEETGILPQKMWVVPNVNSFYSHKSDSISLIPVFLAKADNSAEVILSDEHTEYGWFEAEEARKMLNWPGQKKSLDIILDFLANNSLFISLSEIPI